MNKIFKINLIFLLLCNVTLAGTIINSPISNNNNSKTYFGENNSKGGDSIYNKSGTIKNTTIDMSNNSKAYFGKDNSKGGGKIYIKGGYIDTKRCYKELGIPYDEKKVKITLIDNNNISIEGKAIKVDRCLVKE